MKCHIHTLLLLLAAFHLGGCSDWLNYTPKDKQSEEQQFATKAGVLAAVNGIYNSMSSNSLYGKNLSYEFIDLVGQRYEVNQTDETTYAKYCRALVGYDYTQETVLSTISSIWSTAYHTIMNINVVLENIERDQADGGNHVLSLRDYSMLKGEMLACRAMLHFDMLRLFGPVMSRTPQGQGIPYNETTETQILPILPADDVLENYILRDLLQAQALLLTSDPVVTDGPQATYDELTDDNSERFRQLRLNYYATIVLTARVYMWGGDYTNALTQAKLITDDKQVASFFPWVDAGTLLGNTSTPDRMFSTESLFGIYNDDRGLIYDYHFGPDDSGRNLLVPRVNYIDGILFAGTDVGDYRYQSQWENATNLDGDATKRFLKFKDISDTEKDVVSGSTSDKSEILKSQKFYGTFCSLIKRSEAYYIASEASEKLGKTMAAWKSLNAMRTARGIPTKTPDEDYTDLLTKEYIREYMGEGQIFFYFKRLNKSFDNEYNAQKIIETAIMGTYYLYTENVTEAQKEARYTLPLPTSETENR